MSKRLFSLLAAAWLSIAPQAGATDLGEPAQTPSTPAPTSEPISVNDWTFRVTPYGWLTSLKGSQTIRGRTSDVNASFVDVIDKTLGNGGSLIGLMTDMEARKGNFALFGDVIWEKVSVGKSGARSRSVAPGISGSLGAALDLKYQMAIVEAGGAYEFARWGPVSFDVLAGARYWNQTADLDLNVTGTLDLRDLAVSRNKAIARSGTVDWVDGFGGGRVRIALAPGQQLFFRGDVGAGGSKLSWQTIAAYSYDFGTKNGITYSGVLGYKALYVDYAQGTGRNRYRFDMLQYGPVIGLNIRF